ncbi:response regulator transcription factor [Cecembia lonarensis]|uniref:Sensory transduction protein regX3 n=1 Tax=Cecembia lonarensis (strain CCUG 58316 / KCTC 22772 / LW9) TaxID=1225176 RepID=K1L6R8_CECL9|nr:response regulator transcription factor [Cecembia lonarensis]EKB50451.1 Sensory transduction protein regX3 [Cecembia lonarensis LW9]
MKYFKVVIIDDQQENLKLLKSNFEKEKAKVEVFQAGEEALIHLKKEKADLVICDWLLDDMDGLELCRLLKKNDDLEKIPFIMLSNRNLEIDVVTALEVGADDYMVKPVRVRELMVRAKKMVAKNKVPTDNFFLERHGSKTEKANLISYKNILLDRQKYQLRIDQQEVQMTLTEFKLLELFLQQKGIVLSRGKIMDLIYGSDYGVTERAVDVLVVSLRKKIPILKKDLESIRGVGYRLRGE